MGLARSPDGCAKHGALATGLRVLLTSALLVLAIANFRALSGVDIEPARPGAPVDPYAGTDDGVFMTPVFGFLFIVLWFAASLAALIGIALWRQWGLWVAVVQDYTLFSLVLGFGVTSAAMTWLTRVPVAPSYSWTWSVPIVLGGLALWEGRLLVPELARVPEQARSLAWLRNVCVLLGAAPAVLIFGLWSAARWLAA